MLATPSLHTIYRQAPDLGKALVIGISQSGKAEDVRAVLADARRAGALTLAITNFDDSPLAAQRNTISPCERSKNSASPPPKPTPPN